MSDAFTIRQLTRMPDLVATVDLQKAVWGMRDVEVASPHTLRAIVHSGGVVIAAESAGRLVGFCTGFAAWRGDELWLWSHMAGVLPSLQGGGIGFRLKQAQREWALANGYRRMAWTFDPLQSGNANFNFNRLGAIARNYSANHYGEMNDGINAGLASDRLEAQWQLDAPHVIALACASGAGTVPALVDACKLVYQNEIGIVQREPLAGFDSARYRIEIPLDIAELKQRDMACAQAWQLDLRAAMTELLAAGYTVSGFHREGEKAWYILSRDA